ncbi:VOC family protein [Chengkuizengella marina]|uniref:VOC family protein n=1 Tax=Chengkuizengella marina TaxID=2507566 RepID=A0A6N9Q5B2_9BACL|nr:VOC family protein [Chengkuizengella marina]NBI30028.1 VOC family protein [Chengkuizengella marina]
MIKGLYEAHLPVKDLSRSIEFYEKLGLELASKNEKVVFFWIEKGKSWLGLWESEKVNTPYHPSLRHIAFQVDLNDIRQAKHWLLERGIEVREEFGITPKEPIVLLNKPHAHAAIYFHDPDGNSLELITPLQIDDAKVDVNNKSYLSEWKEKE